MCEQYCLLQYLNALPIMPQNIPSFHHSSPPKSKDMSQFSDQYLFHYSLITYFIITPLTFVSLQFVPPVAYGKHNRPGSALTISPSLAWFLMESPTVWLTLLLFPLGQNFSNPKAFILMSPFFIHYFHRTCIYPIRIHISSSKKTSFPVSVAIQAFVFNLLNGYVQSRCVSHYKSDYESDELFWWKFFGGLIVFVMGMWINIWSDNILVGFKREGGGYKIPRGGFFELVSCANYFGEILEWFGWAVMAWSWAGLVFFLYTCANLVPRACATHKWYLEKFEDYPKRRKAVIPFLC